MSAMKIRSFGLIRVLAFFLSLLLRLWMSTLRYHVRPHGSRYDPWQVAPGEQYIYAFWHESLLVYAYLYGRRTVQVLISEHADGELVARIARHLGYSVVRGSSTRGGQRAVREMVELCGAGKHVAVTPDGPRGPRRRLQLGMIFLASRTGIPILPSGTACTGAWRLRSWDRFMLPHPGCAAYTVVGDPIHVPAGLGRDGLESYRRHVETVLNDLTEEAERICQGVRPVEPAVERRRAA